MFVVKKGPDPLFYFNERNKLLAGTKSDVLARVYLNLWKIGRVIAKLEVEEEGKNLEVC